MAGLVRNRAEQLVGARFSRREKTTAAIAAFGLTITAGILIKEPPLRSWTGNCAETVVNASFAHDKYIHIPGIHHGSCILPVSVSYGGQPAPSLPENSQNNSPDDPGNGPFDACYKGDISGQWWGTDNHGVLVPLPGNLCK